MGYDRITSWVESHFNPRDYNSYFEFEQAVKQRFNSDGIDLPKGAESEMMDHFEGYFSQQDNTIIRTSSLDNYTAPSPEILEISPDFINLGAPLTETVQPLPEIFQDMPQVPSQSAAPSSFFGKIGGFFKRLFKI